MLFGKCPSCGDYCETPYSKPRCPTCNVELVQDEQSRELARQRYGIHLKDDHPRVKPKLPTAYSRIQLANLAKMTISLITLSGAGVFLVFAGVKSCSAILPVSDPPVYPKPSPYAEEGQRIKAKAEVMRRHGFTGSDYELAKGADAIKRFNELEEQRRSEDRKVLGD